MLTFEFFPPATPEASTRLTEFARQLTALGYAQASVTNGALGRDAAGSLSCLNALKTAGLTQQTAHLIGWGKTQAQVDDFLTAAKGQGISSYLALRGDARDGYRGTFTSGARLAGYIRQSQPDARIAVAGYPEPHPETRDLAQEIDILKAKQDAGADRIITQFCFDRAALNAWRDGLVRAGVSMELRIGILPIRDLSKTRRFAERCGASLPTWLQQAYGTGPLSDQQAADLSLGWIERLRSDGFLDFQLFTLNAPQPSLLIAKALAGTSYLRKDLSMSQAYPSTWSQVLELFPSVSKTNDGLSYNYWDVPQGTRSQKADLDLGLALGEQTLAVLARNPEASVILRRILRALPQDCQVAEGFLCAIEDKLTRPAGLSVRQAVVC